MRAFSRNSVSKYSRVGVENLRLAPLLLTTEALSLEQKRELMSRQTRLMSRTFCAMLLTVPEVDSITLKLT